ncbi:MAG: IS110 family transposase [Pyrinomonadaceae bacterium]
MSSSVAALGIDIAKLKFDVCLIKENGKAKHKVFANTKHGFEQLIAWLASHEIGSLHACLEATGTYGEALAVYLFDAGFTVSVVNPAQVKAFAVSRLTRTKTDKVDAELIARFCLAQQPQAWTPPASEVRELQALARRLESLIEMRVAEENRLSSGISIEAVSHSLEVHIAYLIEEIKQTERLIREHINNHPNLKEQSDLLDSIPGIGATTAALLLAEITDFKQYKSARQVAAYAGLVPRERRSGSSVRGRTSLSKIGNARLRKALYFPAMTALRCSGFFQQWAAGLRERGKCKMAVIGAAMRKLIHLAYGVLKTGKPFDPNWTMKIA